MSIVTIHPDMRKSLGAEHGEEIGQEIDRSAIRSCIKFTDEGFMLISGRGDSEFQITGAKVVLDIRYKGALYQWEKIAAFEVKP